MQRGIRQYLGDQPGKLILVFVSLLVVSGAVVYEFFIPLYAAPWEIAFSAAILLTFVFEKLKGKTLAHAAWGSSAIATKRLLLFLAGFVILREAFAYVCGFGSFAAGVLGVLSVWLLQYSYFAYALDRPAAHRRFPLNYQRVEYVWAMLYGIIVFSAAVLAAVQLLERLSPLESGFRYHLFQFFGQIAWPAVVLLVIFALRKPMTYLFLEAKSLNIFGFKSEFRSAREVLNDGIEKGVEAELVERDRDERFEAAKNQAKSAKELNATYENYIKGLRDELRKKDEELAELQEEVGRRRALDRRERIRGIIARTAEERAAAEVAAVEQLEAKEAEKAAEGLREEKEEARVEDAEGEEKREEQRAGAEQWGQQEQDNQQK